MMNRSYVVPSSRWQLFAFAVLVSTPDAVWAQKADQKQDLSVLGGVGASGGLHGMGVEFDLTLKYRYALWEVGTEVRAAGWFPTTTMVSLGGITGITFGDPWSLHLWGAGGVHFYSGVGGSLSQPLGEQDPGVSAVLPYLGGRVLAGYATGERNRFFVGLMGLFDRDLRSVSRTSSFDAGGREREEPHNVGQWMGGVLLVAGLNLGL